MAVLAVCSSCRTRVNTLKREFLIKALKELISFRLPLLFLWTTANPGLFNLLPHYCCSKTCTLTQKHKHTCNLTKTVNKENIWNILTVFISVLDLILICLQCFILMEVQKLNNVVNIFLQMVYSPVHTKTCQ